MARIVDNNLILKRSWGEIRYAVRSNGNMPAKRYIENLSHKERIRLENLLEKMAEIGEINNIEKFRKLEDNIYEFKSNQHRTPCFQVSNSWVLTHGFIKKRGKTPRKEIKRAKEIMEEHLERGERRKK